MVTQNFLGAAPTKPLGLVPIDHSRAQAGSRRPCAEHLPTSLLLHLGNNSNSSGKNPVDGNQSLFGFRPFLLKNIDLFKI